MLQGESVDFDGKHLQVQNAKALYPPVQKTYPPLYFGGSSDAAHELAAEQVDVYPEPYASLAGRGVTNLTGPFGEMIANDVLPVHAKA